MGAPDYGQLDRLKGLMESWADWCHGYGGARLGFSPRSAGLSGAGNDFDGIIDGVEEQVFNAIDTVVGDMSAIHSCAIHHRYLHSVYRFRNYATALDEAHEKLMKELPKKNVVI